MQTLCRQDGSPVELSDTDAAKWLKMGLAKAAPAKAPAAPAFAKPSFAPVEKKAD